MGGIGMAALIIGMFFARYWRRTHDRLYLFFGASFAVQAVDRFILGLAGDPSEERAMIYLLRLLAYVLIIVAIVDKNRSNQLEA
jgi:hypothetical protein